jgi:hypothetical protein
MINKWNYIFFAALSFSLTSCDKVENPIKPAVLLDTTIYPGNWDDYPGPVFTQNTNTLRNVLLEDYTGHRCPNCPEAAAVAADLEAGNPSRIFVASIHAGPGGLTSFQQLASDCGLASNPTNEYCTEFFNTESLAYGAEFQTGFGFFGNPQGNINRISFDGSTMFQFSNEWNTRVSEVLTANDLKVNIQAQTNYYAETNGFYLHVETEFLQDLAGEYNLSVYLIENSVVDFQDSLGNVLEDYHHHNVFRGCLDGLAWGQSIPGDHTTGEKKYFDYSYSLPTGTTNGDYHLLIYVHDVETYEILQVIKQDL